MSMEHHGLSQQEQAENEGRASRKNGGAQADNPYKPDEWLFGIWLEGWIESKRQPKD